MQVKITTYLYVTDNVIYIDDREHKAHTIVTACQICVLQEDYAPNVNPSICEYLKGKCPQHNVRRDQQCGCEHHLSK
jgi:hypothetical protein